MRIILLAAGAAALAITAGPVLAASKGATAMGPKQPIPYSQLTAYLKASPKQRATKDWWSGQEVASAGASANTSATAPVGADAKATPDATTGTATTANPPSAGGDAAASSATTAPSTPAPAPPASGQVNPSTSPPPDATPSTTPPK